MKSRNLGSERLHGLSKAMKQQGIGLNLMLDFDLRSSASYRGSQILICGLAASELPGYLLKT